MTVDPRPGRGLTLDAGALIALDRGSDRVRQLLYRASVHQDPITVPATALAQAVRSPERQVRLNRLLRQPTVTVAPMDRRAAVAVGRMLAESTTSDVVDAHVVLCARRAGQPIVTSDPDDLRRLDPEAVLVPL